MKTSVVVFFFALLPLLSNGQCEYAINEIDKFTKTELIVTKLEYVYRPVFGDDIQMALAKTNSDYGVVFSIFTEKTLCFDSDSKLLLLLQDSSIVTLSKMGSKFECSELERDGNALMNKSIIIFSIDKGQLEALKTMKLVMVRLISTDEQITTDLSKNNTEKKKAASFFERNVQCVIF